MLQGSSLSDYAEESLIAKLKIELGTAPVNKYVLMNADMQNSVALMHDFKQRDHHGIISGVELSVKVLRTGIWDYQGNESLKLPSSLTKSCEYFDNFFKSQHSGKNLKWLPSLGECEVKSKIYKKPYTFTFTTYQTTIIMLYNDKDVFTFQELLDLTKLPNAMLSTQLFNMMNPRMGRLLFKQNSKVPKLTPDEQLTLNMNFDYSTIKIVLLPIAKHKVIFYIYLEIQRSSY